MVVAFASAAAVTLIFIPLIKQMLEASGALRENFLGEAIPTGLGVGFLPGVLSGSFILALMESTDTRLVLLNALGFAVMSLAGIVDDMLGNSSVKGLKGHIKSLLHRRLTTGGLKAAFGGVTALLISAVISESLPEGIVNCLLVMLFTNLVNLLDLRPGRAVKSFFLLWWSSFFLMPVRAHAYILYPPAGCLVAYLPYDAKRKGMMGDAGSNAIGLSLGLYYCMGAVLHHKVAVMVLLILLHFAAEKYSFTGFIARNRMLRLIDELGNKRSG
ncbi:MAG TPA: glycosyl transferase [Bacillota bacterium]|nr:glycosyl transferase [Bacillota bacterium]